MQTLTRDEWIEAASRAQFVREDCSTWGNSEPAQIVTAYHEAQQAGDRVGMYLLARYGPPALRAGFGAPDRKKDAALVELEELIQTANSSEDLESLAGISMGPSGRTTSEQEMALMVEHLGWPPKITPPANDGH